MFKKGVISVIISFLIVLLITPFTIYGDDSISLSSPFLGINVNILSSDHYGGILKVGSLTLTARDDNNTNGQIRGRLNCQTWDATGGCKTFQADNTTTNGLHINLSEIWSITQNANGSISGQSASYVTEFEFILDNYYVGYFVVNFTNNQGLNDSETVYVNGTSVSVTRLLSGTNTDDYNAIINSYDLSVLDNNKTMWSYPIESYAFINQFYNLNYEQIGINDNYNYLYPIFNLTNGDSFQSSSSSLLFRSYLVIGVNKNIYNINSFNSFFNIDNGNVVGFSSLYRIDGSNPYSIIRVLIEHPANSSNVPIIISAKSNLNIMPIYFDRSDYKNISTDFAINFGLSNNDLDNMNLIANGNENSNNSSNQLDNNNSILSNNQSTLFNQEDTFNTDFNSKVGNISTNNNLNTFGSGFTNSAQWVRDQFDTITENNIYGQLLGFSLLVGISLLIIGRWFG